LVRVVSHDRLLRRYPHPPKPPPGILGIVSKQQALFRTSFPLLHIANLVWLPLSSPPAFSLASQKKPSATPSDPNRRSYFWAVADDPPPPVRPTEVELLALPTDQKLYVERRDWIRVRVEEEHWDDASPIGPQAAAPPPPGTGVEGGPAGKAVVGAVMGRPPYSLVVSFSRVPGSFTVSR